MDGWIDDCKNGRKTVQSVRISVDSQILYESRGGMKMYACILRMRVSISISHHLMSIALY